MVSSLEQGVSRRKVGEIEQGMCIFKRKRKRKKENKRKEETIVSCLLTADPHTYTILYALRATFLSSTCLFQNLLAHATVSLSQSNCEHRSETLQNPSLPRQPPQHTLLHRFHTQFCAIHYDGDGC